MRTVLFAALFALTPWGPVAIHALFRLLQSPEPTVLVSWLKMWDLQVVTLQARWLLTVFPPLGNSWPGLVSGMVTDSHRLLLGLVYVGLGVASSWAVVRMEADFKSQCLRTISAWIVCTAFFQGLAFLFDVLGILGGVR